MTSEAANIPDGWTLSTISSVTSHVTDGTHMPPARERVGVPLLSAKDIVDGKIIKSESRLVSDQYFASELARTKLSENDVLVTIVGSIGRSAIVPANPKFAFQRSVAILKPSGIAPKYLSYYLRSPQAGEFYTARGRGTAQQGLYLRELKELPIPVAPFSIQQQITDLIDNAESKRHSASKHAMLARKAIERFRQAVLASACSGRLTRDWRDTNSSDGKAVDPTNDDDLLPGSWSRRSVLELCDLIVDCPHSTPKWVNEGFLCVRTSNFKPGVLDLTEIRYVSKETFDLRNRRLAPLGGDVLFSREGSILGIACTIPPSVELCMGQRMMLMRPTPRLCISEYLMHALNSLVFRLRYES